MLRLDLEDITGEVGHPAVGVTITGDGVVSVTRTVAGFTWPVRTGRRITVAAQDFIEDHEAPIGVEVTYQATVGEETAVASITLSSRTAWLSDPLDYTSGIALNMGDRVDDTRPLLAAGSLDTVKRGVVGQATTPLGGRLPIRLGAAREAPTGLTVQVTTWDQEQASALETLIEDAGVLLLRAPHDPQMGLSWGGYIAADVTAEWAPQGAVDWTLTGDVVAPPAMPVLIVRHTYTDVADATGALTYDQVRALQGAATYAWIKRYELYRIGG